MKMLLHTGYKEVILFDFWSINSVTGLVLSCVGIFIMAVLYEGLRWFRVHLQTVFESQQPKNQKNRATSEEVDASTTSESDAKGRITHRQKLLVQTVLFTVQLIYSYWLMLIVMTYNVYLSATVVLGAGVGNWIFASISTSSSKGENYASDSGH